MDSHMLEQDLRAVYGAYEYLRAHDISDHSTTSRLLRAGDLAFLARRVADETDELRGVVMGTHAHSGGRDDVILEAYQCLYWTFALAVAAGDRYDDIHPGEALALASDNGASLTMRAPLSPVLATADLRDDERRRRFLREGLSFIAWSCRQADVPVHEAVRRDLRELRAKEYLQPYWRKRGE
jgi:phosphoribosyl-ATP pyrophosphohydrolase